MLFRTCPGYYYRRNETTYQVFIYCGIDSHLNLSLRHIVNEINRSYNYNVSERLCGLMLNSQCFYNINVLKLTTRNYKRYYFVPIFMNVMPVCPG